MKNTIYFIVSDNGIMTNTLKNGKPVFKVTNNIWATTDKNVAKKMYNKLLDNGYISLSDRGICELDNSNGNWDHALEQSKKFNF